MNSKLLLMLIAFYEVKHIICFEENTQKRLVHGKWSVVINSFSIANVNLFQEFTEGAGKWIFCYKEGILVETDPFPAYFCRYGIFCYNEWHYKEFWLVIVEQIYF